MPSNASATVEKYPLTMVRLRQGEKAFALNIAERYETLPGHA